MPRLSLLILLTSALPTQREVIGFIVAVNTPDNPAEPIWQRALPLVRTEAVDVSSSAKHWSNILQLLLHAALEERGVWLVSKTEPLFLEHL